MRGIDRLRLIFIDNNVPGQITGFITPERAKQNASLVVAVRYQGNVLTVHIRANFFALLPSNDLFN
jgi:hypothetical protein